ncbi:3'-5' exoribonuclease YhaM family protein [Bombilactobacillus thymidiniphilus]|uniref:HD domain-containing protein n=1 Tax=Bombilactobacillus thymidiniphilus TaxID=2923363 RepID=A0ABY4PCL6_9LACO|nr:HD domain-containing protein [Bombilactobacillus thymidiniphilus]UQS83340.1 HD domain-containing protein [Bombilactobacillus thymidiniphilus]
MMTQKIAELKVNDSFELPVLIKQADVRLTKNGKQFLALVFTDDTGTINGKYWDASATDVEMFQTGKIVLLSGKCELYNQVMQVKITSLKLAENDQYSITQFMPHAPISKQQLQEKINDLVLRITKPHWNRVVRYLLQKHQITFFDFPAAKSNHHDYAGGLAFHTISIAHLALAVCKQYPQINEALLIAGVLLHDLGKTSELSGSVGTQYTLAGNLLGHIVIIDEEIVAACTQLKIDAQAEDMLLLRHLIIAHHGLNEYGSPKRPQLLEADVLHQLDELDASINMISKATAKTASGNFSEPVFGLDKRRFYVSSDDDVM